MRDSELVVPVCLLMLAGFVLVVARAFYTRGLNLATVGLVAGALILGLGVMSAYVGFVELVKRVDDSEARKRIRREAGWFIGIGVPLILIAYGLISLCR